MKYYKISSNRWRVISNRLSGATFRCAMYNAVTLLVSSQAEISHFTAQCNTALPLVDTDHAPPPRYVLISQVLPSHGGMAAARLSWLLTDLFEFIFYQLVRVSQNMWLKLALFRCVSDWLAGAPAVQRWIILARAGTWFPGEISPLTTHLSPVNTFVLLRSLRVHLHRHSHSITRLAQCCCCSWWWWCQVCQTASTELSLVNRLNDCTQLIPHTWLQSQVTRITRCLQRRLAYDSTPVRLFIKGH